MSLTLSMNCGSGESLKVSDWCGFKPNARQIRLTADWLIPVAAAIERVDQCVAPTGCCSSVFTITRSTSSSPIVRGLPGRGSSCRPSRPLRAKRPPPPADRVRVTAKLGRDLPTRTPLRRRQNNPATQRQRLCAARPPRPPLQHLPLLTPEHNLDTLRHNRLPSSSTHTTACSPPTNGSLRTNDSAD